MKRCLILAFAFVGITSTFAEPVSAEGEGATLVEALSVTDPGPGGQLAVDSVGAFDPSGGFATIEPGAAAEEIVYYASVDPSTNVLLGVVREEPQAHASGSFVLAAVDVCSSAPGFCDDIPTEVDYWTTLESAETPFHQDCNASTLPPGKNGLFVSGYGLYSCDALQHASLSVEVCIQLKKGGTWHTLHPCMADSAVRTWNVDAVAEVGCLEGRHWYRTWAHGEAINNDGLVVHADTDRSSRVSITCSTVTGLVF